METATSITSVRGARLILGHAHPRVVAAVAEALRDGASFGAPTERESELAELIIQAMPSIEMVRMVSSGTEAAMSAIRLARGYTRPRRDRKIRRLLSRPCR